MLQQNFQFILQIYKHGKLSGTMHYSTEYSLASLKTLLSIPNCSEFKLPFNRPNLSFNVVMKRKAIVEDIYNLIISRFSDQSGIIYCRTKLECENLQKILEKKGIRCKFYHSAMEQKVKDGVLKLWQEDDISVVIGTIAFGMGKYFDHGD